MRRTAEVMGGMPFTIDVPSATDDDLFEPLFELLRGIDRTFSPFIGSSEISRINSWVLAERDASPEVREVLALCREFQGRTRGFFSAWDCGRLDPCGLVKGWAIARVADALDRAGYESYIVDGAGDVFVRGERSRGRPWRVGIRHPVERHRVVGVVHARDRAVATSGTYEHGHHIRDPHTGARARELVSFTVIGPDIVAADAYATAGFAMGRAGLAFVEELEGYEALAMDADLQSASTRGFDAYLA